MCHSKFHCDVCGRFVSGDDIFSRRASHIMLTPENAFGGEEWETLCVNHNNPRENQIKLMKPEQQSILAAEILGWTHIIRHPEVTTGKCPLRNDFCTVPAFHSDANAALQLVEWMKTGGPWPLFLVWNSDTGTASFCRDDGGEPTVIGTATAGTFQLAVLHAFLRANGKEVE